MVMHDCDTSTQDAEARGSEIQSQPNREFHAVSNAKQDIQEKTYHLSKDKLMIAKMHLFYIPVPQSIVTLSKKRTKIVI